MGVEALSRAGARSRIWGCALVASAAWGLGACSSIESRFVGSPENMQEVGGVPILVQRPRWLKLTYREVYYKPKVTTTTLTYAPEHDVPVVGGGPVKAPARWTTSDVVSYGAELATPALRVDQEILTVGELYAVDIRRPLAGTIKGDITFPDKTATDPNVYQYPTSIGAMVEDKTLKTLNEIVPSLAKKLAGISASTDETDKKAATGAFVESRSQLVKIEIYDLNSDSCTPVVCRWCCEPIPPADGTFPHAKVPCLDSNPCSLCRERRAR